MESKSRRRCRWCVVVCMVALAVSGGYWLFPAGLLTAQGPAVRTPAPPPAALSHAQGLSEAFRYAAEQVLPAVVSIRNTVPPRVVRAEPRNPRGARPRLPKEFEELDPFFRRFFEEFPFPDDGFDLREMPRMSSGSGVIIDPSGLILTNNHVVAGGGKITVRLHDGREFEATEVKTDPNTDLAVVRIKPEGTLPSARLGDSDQLRIGDWVLAVGQPFGLENTVTAGIVSATGRAVGITRYDEFIQTDAAINPGNSGGPLVNLMGEVVGINTAISTSSGGFQGVGFAIPANVAKWVSSQLVKEGKVHRAYLGIGIQPLDQALANQLGLPSQHGALVTEVQPDSPAAKAGIQPQDVIVEFAGTKITSPRNLAALASRSPIGSTQPVVVIRDGKRLELKVTLREAPPNYGERPLRRVQPGEEEGSTQFNKLGLQVGPLTPEVANQLGLAGTSGVVITAVEEGSPADRAGLAPSMVITQVGRKPIRNVAEFEAEIRQASLEKGVLLLVRSAEGSRFVVLKAENQ